MLFVGYIRAFFIPFVFFLPNIYILYVVIYLPFYHYPQLSTILIYAYTLTNKESINKRYFVPKERFTVLPNILIRLVIMKKK